MITRAITPELHEAAREYPAVSILGPRQSGKTTLARMTFPGKAYVSLEDPDVRMAAEADPRGFLQDLAEGAILDEIQRLPALLSYLQGVIDADPKPGRYILTGSHQPQVHEAITQSLAGRTAILTLWPFALPELRAYKTDWDPFELIVRGTFPGLHERSMNPRRFFNSYLQTYVERDVRSMLHVRDLGQFQRFLKLLAGRVGQLVNLAGLANDVGMSRTTLRNWLNVLEASYVVFELPPYFANVRKRTVRSPKIYFTDPGLAAFLLGIHKAEHAARDPLRGSLYENLVIVEALKGGLNRGIRPEAYFYRDAHGNEVDLLLREEGRLVPIEIKSAATFSREFTKGLARFAAADSEGLAPGVVLYRGDKAHTVHGVRVMNPLACADLWAALVG